VATTLGMAALVRHRLPELLEEPVTAASLAQRAGLDPIALQRLLRAQATLGTLDLLPDGRFVANAITRTLRADGPGCDDVVTFFASDANLRAWATLDPALRSSDSAWMAANGRDL
jgi:hypothetical protein